MQGLERSRLSTGETPGGLQTLWRSIESLGNAPRALGLMLGALTVTRLAFALHKTQAEHERRFRLHRPA